MMVDSVGITAERIQAIHFSTPVFLAIPDGPDFVVRNNPRLCYPWPRTPCSPMPPLARLRHGRLGSRRRTHSLRSRWHRELSRAAHGGTTGARRLLPPRD